VTHSGDADDFCRLSEDHAVVAHAQAEGGWVNSLEPLDVAQVGIRKSIDGLPDAADGSFVERRQVCQGGLGPQNLLHFRLLAEA
jgi:hypothetical protein